MVKKKEGDEGKKGAEGRSKRGGVMGVGGREFDFIYMQFLHCWCLTMFVYKKKRTEK